MYENSYFDYIACDIHKEKGKKNQEEKKQFQNLIYQSDKLFLERTKDFSSQS